MVKCLLELLQFLRNEHSQNIVRERILRFWLSDNEGAVVCFQVRLTCSLSGNFHKIEFIAPVLSAGKFMGLGDTLEGTSCRWYKPLLL